MKARAAFGYLWWVAYRAESISLLLFSPQCKPAPLGAPMQKPLVHNTTVMIQKTSSG